MKFLTLLLIVMTVAACRKEEAVWDKLSAEDQRVIRERASAKCINEERADIERMISSSTTKLNDARRLDSWKVATTKNAAAYSDSKIHVFKITATDVYFVHIQSSENGTFSKFIKVSKARNAEQYQDLQRKKCDLAAKDTFPPEKYTSASLTGASFVGNMVRPRVTNRTANTYSIDTFTYTYSEGFPAFFGLIAKTRENKVYNEDTNVSTSTETYKTTITVDTDIDERDFGDVYTDSNAFPNPQYCVATYTPEVTGPPLVPIFYPTGFAENALFCVTTGAGPDANGDAVSDFPATELLNPF